MSIPTSDYESDDDECNVDGDDKNDFDKDSNGVVTKVIWPWYDDD